MAINTPNMRIFLCIVPLLLSFNLFAQPNAPLWAAFSEATDAELQFTFRQFDYDALNSILQKKSVPLSAIANGETVNFAGGTWEISPSFGKTGDGLDLTVTFKLIAGASPASNVSVELAVSDWKKRNYVLMPAGAYNGNRFRSRRVRYSPKLMDPRDIGPDKPQVVTDIPRLNIGSGASRIQDRSGTLGRPSIGYYAAHRNQIFWLLTQQRNQWGDLGLAIEENRDRSKATLSVSAPLVREKNIYHITNYNVPSPDKAADFQAGDSVRFVLRFYEQEAEEVQDLFDLYAAVRKELLPTSTFDPVLPFSAAFEVQEEKFNRDNWVEDFGYYAIGMRENFLQDWQIGWTGGMITTYALLFEGDEMTRERVKRQFDWLLPNGISPAGFFYDSGEGGDQWYGGDIRYPHTKNWHLVRKGSDGLYFVMLQLMLMEDQGETVPDKWKKPVKGVADALLGVWEKYGQMGQFVHSETGEIMVGGSTSGAILPAAFLLCSEYFKDEKYAEAAQAIAAHFYQNYTAKGLSYGGPGDAMQNPDSESSFALVESYVALYEATGNEKWKKYAEDAAKQYSTWVLAYDYEFPESSCFGQLDMHSTGAVFANTQNRHAAPHICTHSGYALLRLYRYTGDTFYLDLLHETIFNAPQYLSTEERPVCDMKSGWMNERVQTTDWETTPIGEIFKGSTWAETATLLGLVQVPGFYVDPVTETFKMMDNLEVKLIKNTANRMQFEISNPTAYDAELKVWVDRDKSAAPDPNYLLNAETLSVPKGETVRYRVRK